MKLFGIFALLFFGNICLSQQDILWDDSITVCYSINDAFISPLQVDVLILNGSQIQSLPDSISKLKNLKQLHLGYIQGLGYLQTNKLKKIPEVIFLLENLEVLNLEQNKILKIQPEIKKLKKLKTLSLSGNPIKKFPKEILLLSSLENLSIGIMDFKTIPKEITSLKKLKFLDLKFFKGKKLPQEIGALKNLENLNLSMSKLETIPSNLKKCLKLNTLNIFGCHSINLDQTFLILKNIDNLKSLHLNRIQYLPKDIEEFKSLEFLFIHNDEFTIDYSQLFKTIAKIKSLRSLYLYNETYGDWIVPKEIGLCNQLESLSLYPISEYDKFIISKEIKKLTKLKSFSHKDRIDNFDEIKDLFPIGCYIH